MLQEKGAVNALILCAHAFSRGVIGRQLPGQPRPGHGTRERDSVISGSFITVHPEFHRDTCLPPCRAPDPEFEGVDIPDLVLPAALVGGCRSCHRQLWLRDPAGV